MGNKIVDNNKQTHMKASFWLEFCGSYTRTNKGSCIQFGPV